MLKAKQFLSIYDGFLESGLSVRDYCANQQMTESMFYYWQNKMKEQLPPKRGFVPVVFDNGKANRSSQVPAPVQNLSLIHISEPTRLGMISYAVFCLKKKKKYIYK